MLLCSMRRGREGRLRIAYFNIEKTKVPKVYRSCRTCHNRRPCSKQKWASIPNSSMRLFFTAISNFQQRRQSPTRVARKMRAMKIEVSLEVEPEPMIRLRKSILFPQPHRHACVPIYRRHFIKNLSPRPIQLKCTELYSACV